MNSTAELEQTATGTHTLKVGDVICRTWGYDCTNVNWYRVARASAQFVWLQPIADKKTGDLMSGWSAPQVNTDGSFSDLEEPAEKHKADGTWVNFRRDDGRKWDGKPVHYSG